MKAGANVGLGGKRKKMPVFIDNKHRFIRGKVDVNCITRAEYATILKVYSVQLGVVQWFII